MFQYLGVGLDRLHCKLNWNLNRYSHEKHVRNRYLILNIVLIVEVQPAKHASLIGFDTMRQQPINTNIQTISSDTVSNKNQGLYVKIIIALNLEQV